MLLPKPAEKEFEIVTAGTFPARCYRFVDLGTQPKEYMGTTSYKRMIALSWELPTELMKDGRPFSIFKKYVWSMSEKATLRNHLESWRGAKFAESDFGEGGFDTKKLIGIPCLLSIIHNVKGDKTYANLGGISKIIKDYPMPPAVNETLYFSLDDFNQVGFEKLSENLRAIIMKSPEYAKIIEGRTSVPDDNDVPPMSEEDAQHDSIPF